MWSYFFGGGGRTQQQKELPKKAIVELREHLNLLSKKQQHLQTQIGAQERDARQWLQKGNKASARNSLKRKKTLEQQLERLETQMESLEQQLFAIESANLNLETMRAMKQGAKAMRTIHTGMDIDKVDEAMDDIREQVELGEEISDAISRPIYTGPNEVDEDELDEELAALAEEPTIAQAAPKVAVAPQHASPDTQAKVSKLPAAPSSKIHAQPAGEAAEQQEEEDEDERALRELQAEMGL